MKFSIAFLLLILIVGLSTAVPKRGGFGGGRGGSFGKGWGGSSKSYGGSNYGKGKIRNNLKTSIFGT